MSLIVQKYGGTSVGSVERIQNVAARVKRHRERGDDVVVVVSAMSGETNRLIALANEISSAPSAREMDVLLSTGEQVTIALLCMALQRIGCDARSYTGAQVHILTDSAHSKARIMDIDYARVCADIKAGRVGGLSESVTIHDLCLAQGIPVWCGGMVETGIGRAANAALATLPGFTLPGDISASSSCS